MLTQNQQNDAAAPRRRNKKLLPITPVQQLATEIFGLWAPKSSRMLDAWCTEERYLSADESNEGHSRWQFDRVPHALELSRAYSDAHDQVLWVVTNDPANPRAIPWTKYNEQLCWMSSAQQAKTQTICNIIGHHMTDDPRQILVILPDDKLRRVFSLNKLGTMLRDTPCLQGKISDNKSRGKENTIESKSFPGGGISILISSSGNNLRSWSGPILICDEFDGWIRSANKQGDPFMLALDRQQTFSRKKTFVCSTPLDKETSQIEPMYDAGTREQWHWPCPTCGGFQVVAFDDRFDHEDYTYTCEHCGVVHSEEDWRGQATSGRWIARNPDAEYRSFHTSAMTSLLTNWHDIEKKFKLAIAEQLKGDPEKYRTFVNTIRGETYEEKGETLAENHFTRLDNPQRHWYYADVPRGVKVLTCAIDTQDDRVEFEVRGWGSGQETWGIQYGVIYGHPDDKILCETVDALLQKAWIREDGAQLMISRLVWDAMGHYPDEVYAYTREREPQVYAIRGGSVWHAPVVGLMGKVNRKGLETPIFTIGTIAAKDALYNRLQVAHAGPRFCHWPVDEYLADGTTRRMYDQHYFDMLLSEKRVTRLTGGRPHSIWVPKKSGIRNEAWDLLVYNLAALMTYLGGLSIDDLPEPDAVVPYTPSPSGGRRVLSRGVRA